MAERENMSVLCNELITRIKARPEMWSASHPLYMNRVMYKNFWAEASAELGADEHILKKRWKHLKDQFRKEIKKAKEKGMAEENIAWQYFDAMQFLREELSTEKTRSSMPVESEGDSDEDEREIASKVRIVEASPSVYSDENMKLNMIYNGVMETKAAVEERMKMLDDVVRHDPDYMYLMSLLPTLKQLSEIQKLQLKGKVNEWLLEALTENAYAQCETKYNIVTDIQMQK